jgi:DNA-binding CsgD family transcriptional regulator
MGRGDFDTAARLLDDAARTRSGNVFHVLGCAQTLASLRILQGRSDEALAVARATLAEVDLAPDTSFVSLIALALDASCRTGGDPAEARTLQQRADHVVRVLHEREAMPADLDAWHAIATAWSAEIAGGDPVPHWERAIAEFERLGIVVEAAWAKAELACRLVAAEESRARATELVAEAHDVARQVSATPLLRFVRSLARRARLDVPGIEPAPTAEQLGLTDREVSVLRLLADGRTNKDIATALFISAKTASVHVSNILRKLGATTRGEAAAVARRHGLAS